MEGAISSEWAGTAVLGALLAAFGYVAKLIIEFVTAVRRKRRERQAALVRLGSLLQASAVAFKVQKELARRLLAKIAESRPDFKIEGGDERAMSRAYDSLTDEEREMHKIVRGYTISALRPTNEKLLEWVREDTYFKGRKSSNKLESDFALELSLMEAHLLLWLAKYEAWIPDSPHHALVYLADEQAHGLGFPRSIDGTVAALLGRTDVS